MKNAIIAVVTAALIVTAGYVASGEDYPDQDLRVFEGTVTAVSANSSSLTVQGAIQMTFHVSPGTNFTDQNQSVSLSDVDVGDYVSVQYHSKDPEGMIPEEVLAVSVEYTKAGEPGFSESTYDD